MPYDTLSGMLYAINQDWINSLNDQLDSQLINSFDSSVVTYMSPEYGVLMYSLVYKIANIQGTFDGNSIMFDLIVDVNDPNTILVEDNGNMVAKDLLLDGALNPDVFVETIDQTQIDTGFLPIPTFTTAQGHSDYNHIIYQIYKSNLRTYEQILAFSQLIPNFWEPIITSFDESDLDALFDRYLMIEDRYIREALSAEIKIYDKSGVEVSISDYMDGLIKSMRAEAIASVLPSASLVAAQFLISEIIADRKNKLHRTLLTNPEIRPTRHKLLRNSPITSIISEEAPWNLGIDISFRPASGSDLRMSMWNYMDFSFTRSFIIDNKPLAIDPRLGNPDYFASLHRAYNVDKATYLTMDQITAIMTDIHYALISEYQKLGLDKFNGQDLGFFKSVWAKIVNFANNLRMNLDRLPTLVTLLFSLSQSSDPVLMRRGVQSLIR